MAESNQPHSLSGNDQHDKSVEDASHDGMSIQSVFLPNITETKSIKLRRISIRVSGVDRKEDDPGDGCSDEANEDRRLEKPEI